MLDPRNRTLFLDLLEGQYLSRFLKNWDKLRNGPLPDLKPFPEPDPPPFLNETLAGDLLVRALGDPDAQPSKGSIIDQIREEKLHVEVLKDLLAQLQDGVAIVKADLDRFSRS